MKESEFKEFYNKYIDMVYRITYTYFKGNKSNMEDVCQDVFIKVLDKKIVFDSEEHAKAWLITCTTNMCKNKLKHWWNRNVNIDNIEEISSSDKEDSLLPLVLNLPCNQRIAIYLHYYEGYEAKEISKIMHKNENTIFGYLHQGREMLKEKIGGEL